MKNENHAIQNAIGWSQSIVEMVAALECDYGRLAELEDERAGLVAESESASGEGPECEAEARATLDAWDAENGEELRDLIAAATVGGDRMPDADAARERIEESALSVEVRGDWRAPGESGDSPAEFRILLTTGGPALQIRGELGAYCEPSRAWIEYQDWGTPWTEFHGAEAPDQKTLLAFCRVFYFDDV